MQILSPMEWVNTVIVEIADALDSGLDIKDITFIDGTVYKTRDRESIYDAIEAATF